MSDDETPADSLAAYHLEIFETEDEWFEDLEAAEDAIPYPKVYMPPVSPWREGCWNGLREIQEQHGIDWLNDPMVFSIASYLHEIAPIERRWKNSVREHEDH